MPGPGEGVGGGLVAGQKDGQNLVAELPVAHALAGLLVAGFEQHREKVAGIFSAAGFAFSAASLDDVVD